MASDVDLLRKPIVIVGAPRSGTAILAGVLRAHPDLAYAREPRLLWRFGNDGKSDLLRRADARPEVVAHIRAAFTDLVREQGRVRLVEKTPHNSLRLEFVDAVLPDAKFVHIIRHGPDTITAIRGRWLEPTRDLRTPRQRDRVRRHLRETDWRRIPHYAGEFLQRVMPRSMAPVVGERTWGPRLPGMDGLIRDLDLLDVCALQWRMCVELAAGYGRSLPAGRYIECRVDELTPEVVRKILDFCELDDHPDVRAMYEDAYDESKIIDRSKTLDPAELKRIMEWIAPTVAWLDNAAAPQNPL